MPAQHPTSDIGEWGLTQYRSNVRYRRLASRSDETSGRPPMMWRSQQDTEDQGHLNGIESVAELNELN